MVHGEAEQPALRGDVVVPAVRTDANNIDELDSAIRDENLSVSPKTRDCIAMGHGLLR